MKGREAARRALLAVVVERRSLSASLPPVLEALDERRERALAQELAYGVLRWWPRLHALLDMVLTRGLRSRDADVEILLLLGLYQLLHTRVPEHASVAETVRAAHGLGKPWAPGLVNAVLRRVTRQRDALLAKLEDQPEARHAHPAWMLSALRADWPDDWERVLAENNERPPMTLRVNTRRCTRDAYLLRLADAGVGARAGRHSPAAVILDAPCDAVQLPGFRAGEVSVQDEAAQLAAPLLGARAGQRVLDACAAPGGKTAHILENAPALVLAVDLRAPRVVRVRDTLDRLGLEAACLAGDAGEPASWWDGHPFDRILLDAPCTATGVVRRHPDIKLHRRASDVPGLVATQLRLLDALWPLLNRGGLLLYATCSVLAQENHCQIREFLNRTADAQSCPIDAGWGRPLVHGRQILPGDDGMDGFYYALLAKC